MSTARYRGISHSGLAALLALLSVSVADAHAPLIVLSRTYLNFTASPGGQNPPAQGVILSNGTHGRMPWTATASTTIGGTWLIVTPVSGQLPGVDPAAEWNQLNIAVISTPLSAGVYLGAVTITAPGDASTPPASNSPQVIQVALTIGSGGTTAAPGIGVSPTSLAFTGSAGSSFPATLGLQVTNTGGGTLNWTAAAEAFGGGSWLSVSPVSGTNSGGITATAQSRSLGPGTYTGRITISAAGAANSPQSVPVTYFVRAPAPPGLYLSDGALSFSVETGTQGSVAKDLRIYNSGDGALNWNVDASTFNGGPWLAAAPRSGPAPGVCTVSVLPGGLALGVYSGHLVITADGAVNSPVDVPVTLTVREPATSGTGGSGVTPDQVGAVNSATFLSSFLAPGEIVSIFGAHLGPAYPTAFTLDPLTGGLPTRIAGTQVTFDGVPAPLFYVSDKQINLQVPFELADKTTTRLAVNVDGVDTAQAVLPLRDAAPGVFTVDGTRAAALNQDSTLNSPDNPAVAGSVVQMFLTGQGMLEPPLDTGALAPTSPPFPAPVLPVTVSMNGLDAKVLFAGAAPGFAGLLQVNVEVPRGLQPSDSVGVFVLVGLNPAGKRVTIAVQ